HVAGIVGENPAYYLGRKLQASFGSPGFKGFGAVLVGEQFQAKHQVPAKAGTQVFTYQHRHGGVVACQDQRKSMPGGGNLTPAIVQGKQGCLALVVEELNIVDGNELVPQQLAGGYAL